MKKVTIKNYIKGDIAEDIADKLEKQLNYIETGKKEIKEKVYCSECKYYGFVDYEGACYKVVGEKDTPERVVSVTAQCGIENKDNNCKYYKPKPEEQVLSLDLDLCIQERSKKPWYKFW